MAIIKCKICGESFVGNKRQKYCSEQCAEIGSLQVRRKRCEDEKKKRTKARKEEELRKIEGSNRELTDDAIKERQHDMSYGKYKAQEYKVKIERR